MCIEKERCSLKCDMQKEWHFFLKKNLDEKMEWQVAVNLQMFPTLLPPEFPSTKVTIVCNFARLATF